MNKEILQGIRHTSTYERLIGRFKELNAIGKKLPLLVDGVSDGALYSLLYSLSDDIGKIVKAPILIIVGEERKANKLNEFLKKTGLKCEFYPVRDFNFYDMTASHELEYERLKILSGVLFNNLDVIISTPDALLQFTMPKEQIKLRTLNVNIDTPLDISEFCVKLIDMGYTACEMVESAGQFSVRGGIIDIFPTNCDFKVNGEEKREGAPVRIELFGDEIDRMAIFDTMSQRMTEKIDSFIITPSKEIIAGKEKLNEVREEICQLLTYAMNEDSIRELKKEISTIDGELQPSFLDRFISLIYPEKECLLDYFSENSSVIVCDTPTVARKAQDAQSANNELVKGLIENNLIPSKYSDYSAPVSKIDRFCEAHQCINVDTFIMSRSSEQGGLYNFGSKGVSFANHTIGVITEELDYFVKNKYRVVLICQTPTEAKSSVKTLNELNIPAFLAENATYGNLQAGTVAVYCDTYPDGYEIPASKFALVVLSSKRADIKKRALKNKKFAKNAGEKIMSHTDLNVGDYVVHASYGIGRFLGIENMCIMGVYRDYVAIQYAGTDKLFLPVDQLDMVSKYIGTKSADGEVRLSKMGGTEWKRSTQRAKAAAREMAKELIDLYARRTRIDGFSFQPDGIMEREFDSAFEFEETDSQLEAIADIKADMERPYPMDRVLCGDVGYGKTEVALRAAMKCIANNKQVAILVPTTILAMQHYQTALARFAGTGVNIGMISRFRTAKDQAQTLRQLRRGDLDIIIGTHKLLGSKVEFKDLGLLIVDEEQRFGVAQKEKIKQAVPDVDVLSLSATPIPRTLSMAMGGIRDMSVLDEAPEGRVGVQSYVLEYDENIINDAIRRELHRGGQVFYLYNNVEYIYQTAGKIKQSFPEARVAVAHGQMDREDIEDIWHSLVQGDIDILVSTTIIETGIDIPNANTLIIENADKMGLSQLHQIRGRVGRSHRRAYAFFTYRKGKGLTEIAEKRLSAIRDFAEFGAGFKIAMRDLEIRGAGNLLGAEQHGHLDSVGYDMYVRLLNEAVLEEKGEIIEPKPETKITLSCDAYLPKNYVPSSTQRMEMYKKIAHIENEADYNDIVTELRDRFGELPQCAKNLLNASIVKAYAQIADIKKVDQLKIEVRLYPNVINLPALLELSKYDRKNVLISGVGKAPYICVKTDTGADFSLLTVKALKKYKEILDKLASE